MIFLPDPDDAVIEVSQRDPLRIETEPKNLGILNGMEQVARHMSTDYIFLTENDCPMIETHDEAKRQINIALEILLRGDAMMARMRSVICYGEMFDIIDKYDRFFSRA